MNEYVEDMLERIKTDKRVVAVWKEVDWSPSKLTRISLAIEDEHYANFHAQQAKWLQEFWSIAYAYMEEWARSPALALAFLSDGTLWVLRTLPWGSVPEQKPLKAVILFDRSQRLQQRWQSIQYSPRVEFAQLNRWCFRFWIHAWATLQSVDQRPAYSIYHAAQAYVALVHFIATANARLTTPLSWSDDFAILDDIEHHTHVETWVWTMIRWFERMGREIAQSTGWEYPSALEQAVLVAAKDGNAETRT